MESFGRWLTVREIFELTGRTEIHIFDQWCHLTTIDNEAEYTQVQDSKSVFAFDHDTYKLLLKAINSGKYQMTDYLQ